MAKAPQPKTKQRRPAKKPAPLSSEKKLTAKKPIRKPIKKPVKQVATAKPKPKKPKLSAKTATKAKSRKSTSKKTQQIISLPLGRGAHLVLAINHTKASPSKPKPKSKSRKANKKTTDKKRQLIVSALFILSGLGGTSFFGLHAIASPALDFVPTTSQQVVAPPPVEKSLPRSLPTQLRIPDISVDTPLSTVGLKQDGTIEVPAQYDTAGWYDQSPTPGEIGPSVIVGHLDNVHGIAVFWRLRELTPGQIIEVDRQDHTTAKFKVLKLDEFSQASFPTADVYGNVKYAGLRLITCGGSFNRLSGHYDANIVVFAALIPEK